ncbi:MULTISPECIES: hypothetical protein [Arthrobacter]|jgi:ATP-dependent exoDNAse (exonuclease V) beta subunit|uniref:Uncharacterized protein n=1 Tax=Arthrobacter woluwensis TaxID=156980 RepID=A0A1H4KT80_9MICC|nr:MULTISPECIES: hypothetical protein [Arthrobacter]PSS42947.1 hypothetical protein C6401_14545 [Arthrobacter woluwensis]QTF72690.1 hypothetical protein G8758_12235 [Arthrobacter woluwensis]WFR83790.1 hypothetical protein P9849_14705 [Arthrobacter sp. Y-9]SEB61613.1 hypothetical protein SAMN04489745_0785 [Arthrobacter woluwensis]
MGKNILILALVAAAAYRIGVEKAKKRDGDYEDLRHQVERLLTGNTTKKVRRKLAKVSRQGA